MSTNEPDPQIDHVNDAGERTTLSSVPPFLMVMPNQQNGQPAASEDNSDLAHANESLVERREEVVATNDTADDAPISAETSNENTRGTWQKSTQNIKQRDLHLLESGLHADIKFIVGSEQEVVLCHRLYLAKTSSVFDVLLLQQVSADLIEVLVPDITPIAFKTLLRYIYGGTLEVDNYVTAWQVLQAAKKFDMPEVFINMLREYLLKKIDKLHKSSFSLLHEDSKNLIWPSIQFAYDCDEQDLLEVAWQTVTASTPDMLLQNNFVDISSSILEKLVKDELLSCSEISLFNACMRWANSKAARLQQDATPRNLRAILINILPNIRFLSMDSNTFSSGPAQIGILTATEILAVVTRNVQSLELSNFSCNVLARRTPNVPYFYACKERKIQLSKGDPVSESIEHSNKYSKYDYIAMTNFGDSEEYENSNYENESVVGFAFPTQIKRDYSNNDATYEEDITVYVVRHNASLYRDRRNDTIIARVVNINSVVPYNSFITHEFERPACIYKYDMYYTYHVIFHKSGLYPTKCTGMEDSDTFGRYNNLSMIDDQFFILYHKHLPDLQVPVYNRNRCRRDRYMWW